MPLTNRTRSWPDPLPGTEDRFPSPAKGKKEQILIPFFPTYPSADCSWAFTGGLGHGFLQAGGGGDRELEGLTCLDRRGVCFLLGQMEETVLEGQISLFDERGVWLGGEIWGSNYTR